MAMFREHIAIGAILSMVVVTLVYFYALVTDPWLLLILFAITTIGSFLPDVDSDSGMPFYLVYGTMTLAATGVVLLYTLSSHYAADWRYLVGIPLVAVVFFWFVVGGILKRYTHHRGIFHSLPAMALAGFATVLIARNYGLSDTISYVFGAAMAVGFASHLVLDEMHSFVDLEGIPFIPKKSLGTALKLFSDSNRVNSATYLVLAALVYMAFVHTPATQAYFYNDSDVIELGAGVPMPPPENPGENSGVGTSNDAGTSGAGTGLGLQSSDGFGAGNGSGAGDSSGGAGGSNDSSGASNVSGAGTDAGAGSSGASGGAGVSDSTESIQTNDELLDYLAQQGAVSGSGLNHAQGSLSGSGTLEGNGTAEEGEGFDIIVLGSKVRDTLLSKYRLQDILQSWRTAKTGHMSAREYGLVAASTALRDNNIDTVSFTADTFAMTYRSRGYLFTIIPVSFPVRVSVVPLASAGRVTVQLPWYRFFVREFFTTDSLSSEIDGVLQTTINANTDVGADLNAKLFEAVTQFLRKKIGTISDSMYLGTPVQ